MEMTEIMKRYEEQYGLSPWEEVLTEDFNLFIYDEFKRLERENIQLKDQLRWRPVSEEPREGQIVFTLIQTGWVVAQYLHGEFYVEDGFTFGDRISGVISWLPIPPAPEGETDGRV